MHGPVSVLALVGDGPATATIEELEAESDRIALSVSRSVADGLAQLEGDSVDCVVASGAVLETDEDLLDRIQARDPTVPVVVVLDANATTTPATALDRGATDYVRPAGTPAGLEVLATRVEHAALAARATASADEPDGPDADADAGADAEPGPGTDDAGGPADIQETDDAPVISPGTIGTRERDLAALSRETLEQRVREYESIIRALPDEIAIVANDGEMLDVIPPTGQELSMAGYHPEELRGEPLTHVLTDETVERGWTVLADVASGERQRGTFEMELETRDGRRLRREGHLALLEDTDGSPRGSVTVLRDIEERKTYEEELERQNERLEQFASIASHDLRSPLNVAKGHVELLEEAGDGEHAEAIERALDRMAQLIDDTLTWARQGSTVEEREPIALGDLAPASWEAVGTDAASLTVEDGVTVEGDPDRVRRVVENLLRNAVEHGGEDVHVEIGALEGTGAGDADRGSGFYVADDGPGIPADERDSVFDAGVTTASDGTGFGLAIISEICEAHGWEIDVTESEAGGARFEITGVDLPA